MRGKMWEVYVGGNFVQIGEVGMKKQCDREKYLGGDKTIARMHVHVSGELRMRRAIRLAKEIVALHNASLDKV
jgi:hypothetical protein